MHNTHYHKIFQHLYRHKKILPALMTTLFVFTTACSLASILEGFSAATESRECQQITPNEGPNENTYQTVIEEFEVIAPSGNTIYALIRRPDPDTYPDSCFPAVVKIPGGINPGRLEALGRDAQSLAGAGMVVITFNAEGRADDSTEDIRSEGSEDYNGFRNQDGLCEIVKQVMDLEYVIPENVGLWSNSYGITMAAGCARRYPDIPIKYIVDGEGPANSFVTCHEPYSLDNDSSNDKVELVYDLMGHYSLDRDPSPENEAFWEEREAERLIGGFRGRYLRLQAEWDHAQPPSNPSEIEIFNQPPLWWHNKHTTIMVNTAVEGGVPWVRVNLPPQGNQVNAMYDLDNPPVYLPGNLKDKPWAVIAVLEMARME
ncbi:MAG: hypothetical protein MUO76_00985 [Anaerolineaceae bacterium]|nr:hypothetical protein [Anaerolineaceae bacterium]